MKSTMTRTLRRGGLAAPVAICALLLSACGAPRVHEVYRLSSFDDGSRLNPTQQDLRRLALTAQQVQPRSASPDAADLALASLAPGNMQACAPGHLALFTGMSGLRPAGERKPSLDPVLLAQSGL